MDTKNSEIKLRDNLTTGSITRSHWFGLGVLVFFPNRLNLQ